MILNAHRGRDGLALVAIAVVALLGTAATANTLTQNTSWTIDNPNTSTTYRVVAYGDSIFAGYYGSIWNVDRRAAPYVSGEYLTYPWNADIQVIRRTKSGAKADDIYYNKIIDERSYMESSNTRVVMFEMCGNDYLQARDNLAGQSGTCDPSPGDDALATCTAYMEAAMQAINYYAPYAKAKVIANLYYPGYNDDNKNSNCTDASTGQPVNEQDQFLPILAHSNWRACHLAQQYGFACEDSFAEYMGADYDSNGDGIVDSEALRYQPGESEAAYVHRITVTLRPTIRDANYKLVNSSTIYDYLLSDNTHPTYYGNHVRSGLFHSTGSGSSPPDFSSSQFQNGRNPVWNTVGHERMGWALSLFNPLTP